MIMPRGADQLLLPVNPVFMWATLLAEKPDDTALADRFKRAFLYYRDWHR